MPELDDSVTPEPIADADPSSLDVQPTHEEYFVLSRIDGNTNVADLCRATGLGTEKTIECLRKLTEYGLVHLPGEDPPPSESDETATSTGDESSGAATDDSESKSTDADDGPGSRICQRFPADFDDYPFDQQLLEQSVELDDDFKREVIFVYDQIDGVDHYQLLGVERDVGRRPLRKSYFQMSKRYHPDRFYQKILGDYESMIEAIFQRVTRAYQTLTNARKRKEYDQQLEQSTAVHQQHQQASTPASRQSESRAGMKGDKKKEMAYKVLVQRSDEALEEGRFSQALDGYRKALSLKRDAQLAIKVASRLLEANERLDDAAGFARAAHKIDNSSPAPLQLLGRVYEKKGAVEDAIYHYKQALEAGGDKDQIRRRLTALEQ